MFVLKWRLFSHTSGDTQCTNLFRHPLAPHVTSTSQSYLTAKSIFNIGPRKRDGGHGSLNRSRAYAGGHVLNSEHGQQTAESYGEIERKGPQTSPSTRRFIFTTSRIIINKRDISKAEDFNENIIWSAVERLSYSSPGRSVFRVLFLETDTMEIEVCVHFYKTRERNRQFGPVELALTVQDTSSHQNTEVKQTQAG